MRFDMSSEEAEELTLNWDSLSLPIKFPYLLSCTARLINGQLAPDHRLVCERVIGSLAGKVLLEMRPLGKGLFIELNGPNSNGTYIH